MSGFGGIPFGGGPFGGPSPTFNLSTAAAFDYRSVDLSFSNDLLLAGVDPLPATVDVGSYSISPSLPVVAVVQTGTNTVRVYTTAQNPGTIYTITVTGALYDIYGQTLNIKIAQFTGIASPSKYVVSDLVARSECDGKAVHMTWTNPTSPATTQTKIVRRAGAWPFDLTDTHDVVYEGAPIEEFKDTGIVTPITTLAANVAVGSTTATLSSAAGLIVGDAIRFEKLIGPKTYDIVTIATIVGPVITFAPALQNAYLTTDSHRVAKSKELQAQTYYYYLVLASKDAGPYNYDIDDGSRDYALSIDVFNGANWFTDRTPRNDIGNDLKPAAQGGGGGFLAKWYQVMGCWLNLMRGYTNALSLIGDPDKAPFHVLTSQNQSLGIEPEGLAFDYDIVRRPLTALIYVYKRKGTCPGIVETVRMFTKWDAVCREFGFNACQSGASTLKTWGGESQYDYNTTAAITQQVISADGQATFEDLSKTWDVSLWAEGTLRGWIGDVACVADNTASKLTTKAPLPVTTLSAPAIAGATSLSLASTVGMVPGLTIQLVDTTPVAGVYDSEIVEVLAVTAAGAPGTVSIKGPGLANGYASGSLITIGKSIIRSEYLGVSTAVAGAPGVFTITDPQAQWTENQWAGYKFMATDGTIRNALSNTGTVVVVDGGVAPPAGNYAIAKNITGGSFAGRSSQYRYQVGNGVHSRLFEPTLDLELRGTIYDPFNRLYNGPAAVLTGVWGPDDVGVYITTNVPVIKGRATTAAGSTFDLDTTQPAPAINSLVGYYLNPNQNQEQMFEILSNTATQVTIAGAVSSLVVAGQQYYVLKPRDRVRFERITKRLRYEFSALDSRIHVLFS